VDEIRREGAIFNTFKGALFGGLEVSTALVLWPAYGARSAGIHSGYLDHGKLAAVHTHPDSDEAICELIRSGPHYCGDRWLGIDA